MNLIDPHKPKYRRMYMQMAMDVAKQSVAVRRQVGCTVVTSTGMIAIGWNGMPAGMDNICEWQCEDGKGYATGTTKPEVIHAERNALDKLARQGIPAEGSILFVTCSPCIECAKSIHAVGVKEVWYLERYKCTTGIDFLNDLGIECNQFQMAE